MENFRHDKGRGPFYLRQPPCSVLLQHYFLLLSFGVFYLAFPTLVFSSCTRRAITTEEEAGMAPAMEDSVEVCAVVPGVGGRHLDLFIYSAAGLRALESFTSGTFSNDTVCLRLTAGDKTAVAVVDSPRPLKVSALGKFETMEQLTFNAADENPVRPSMTGTAEFSASDGFMARVEVTPLLCSIVLEEITNNLDGYRRLEDPCMFLTGCNPSAEALRKSGFRPQEEAADTIRAPLPFDIGVYTQYPGTVLHCYPNDTPEFTLGTPQTVLWLECVVKGSSVRFSTPLPPLERGSTTKVSVTVESVGNASWKIW